MTGSFPIPLSTPLLPAPAAGFNPGGVIPHRATGAIPIAPIEGPRGILNCCGIRCRWSVSFPLDHLRQEPPSGFAKAFDWLLSLFVHALDSNEGAYECPSKEFPKTENEFPRLR